jgi:hypothetical protein
MSEMDRHPPIGTTAKTEWRDLDTRRLPVAPPRPGCAPPRETVAADPIVADLAAAISDPKRHLDEAAPMSKTATILEHLKTHARGPRTALKPSQIGAELGGESTGFDTATVAALLRHAKKADANEPLQREKRDRALFWWWGEPTRESTAQPATTVVKPGDKTYPLWAVTDDDHVLAAIHATTDAAHLPDAETHARRLRALAESPILDGSIAEWLHELADLIEFRHC